MKNFAFVFFSAISMHALLPVQSASAAIVAKVSIAQQRMEVYVDGNLTHTWPVSTGREDFDTPTGTYTTQWLDKDHRSQKYDDAPMPYSVFFRGGYAVHGTTSIGMLGRRASHGCVRLSTPNARQLFELVKQHGLAQSKVVVEQGVRDKSKSYVAEIGAKSRRDDDDEAKPTRRTHVARRDAAPVHERVSTRGYAPVYRPSPAYAQPVMVYQIGPQGQMIPVGYRRF